MKEKVKDLDPVKFVVGSRPEWNEELIKQLPHGTVLDCAYMPGDIFVYNGEELEEDSTQDWLMYFKNKSHYFTFNREKTFARIVSLPEETKEPEFQPGEMVYEYQGGKVYQPVRYRFFAAGKHWVSDTIFDTKVYCPQEIRKIHPDPEKKFSDKADEIINTFKQPHGYFSCSEHKIHFDNDSVKMMLIEALKTEVK